MKERENAFKGAIFDLDGTLLDSMWVWRQIDRDFLARRGLTVPEDYMEKITALCFRDAAAYTIERFGLQEKPEALIAEWMEMAKEAYAKKVSVKPGVKEYLRQLQKRGIRIAAATSGDPALFIPCLKNNGIYDYFEALATVAEVKRGKDFPDVYELAAERLGLLPEECMVFEDIYTGILGASKGGFSTTGILDQESSFDWEKIRKSADHVIISFEELLETKEM